MVFDVIKTIFQLPAPSYVRTLVEISWENLYFSFLSIP